MTSFKHIKPLHFGLVAQMLLLTGIICATAEARDGVRDGGGGDPTMLRVELIREFINNDLRQEALAYIENIDLESMAEGPAKAALEAMIAQDVASDIRNSSYVLRNSCRDIGGRQGGGAILNQLRGDICLSPTRLAAIGATKAEIVGLALHEHAHHFGYVDANSAIYRAVFRNLSLSNPNWGETATDGGQTTENPPVVIVTPPPVHSRDSYYCNAYCVSDPTENGMPLPWGTTEADKFVGFEISGFTVETLQTGWDRLREFCSGRRRLYQNFIPARNAGRYQGTPRGEILSPDQACHLNRR